MTQNHTILLVSHDAALCAAARQELESLEEGLRVAAVSTVEAAHGIVADAAPAVILLEETSVEAESREHAGQGARWNWRYRPWRRTLRSWSSDKRVTRAASRRWLRRAWRRPHFPPTENAAIGSSHVELFAMRVDLGKSDIRLLYKIRQRAPHRMQEPWCNHPPGCRGYERRENKQLQKEADRAEHSLEDTLRLPQKFLVSS
jgi:hypothetical protein